MDRDRKKERKTMGVRKDIDIKKERERERERKRERETERERERKKERERDRNVDILLHLACVGNYRHLRRSRCETGVYNTRPALSTKFILKILKLYLTIDTSFRLLWHAETFFSPFSSFYLLNFGPLVYLSSRPLMQKIQDERRIINSRQLMLNEIIDASIFCSEILKNIN